MKARNGIKCAHFMTIDENCKLYHVYLCINIGLLIIEVPPSSCSVPLPRLTPDGYCVLVFKYPPASADYDMDAEVKIWIQTLDLLYEIETLRMGTILIVDVSAFTASHFTKVTPTILSNWVTCLTVS